MSQHSLPQICTLIWMRPTSVLFDGSTRYLSVLSDICMLCNSSLYQLMRSHLLNFSSTVEKKKEFWKRCYSLSFTSRLWVQCLTISPVWSSKPHSYWKLQQKYSTSIKYCQSQKGYPRCRLLSPKNFTTYGTGIKPAWSLNKDTCMC